MSHPKGSILSTQIFGLLSVVFVVSGITINFLLRPDLFSASIPYSRLGATPTTNYIFSGSLILAGLFFLLESHFIANRVQRLGSYAVTLGLIIAAAVPINISKTADIIHTIGAALALFGLLINLTIGIVSRAFHIAWQKRLYYAILLGVGISSAVIAILSSNLFDAVDLLGYAEYSGFLVFAGWTLVDFGDKFTKTKKTKLHRF